MPAIEAHRGHICRCGGTVKEMSERYLGQKFLHWKPLDKGLIPIRPNDRELEAGIIEFQQLFDYLATLPSYRVLEAEETPLLRRFSFEKDGGEGNMLFRPVGQVALAQALGILVFKKGLSLKDIFKKDLIPAMRPCWLCSGVMR